VAAFPRISQPESLEKESYASLWHLSCLRVQFFLHHSEMKELIIGDIRLKPGLNTSNFHDFQSRQKQFLE
jgi:hypothetical protein